MSIYIGSLKSIVSEDITDISISCTSFEILVIRSPFLASVKNDSGSFSTLSYIFFLRSRTVFDRIYAMLLLARKINPFLKRLAIIKTMHTMRSAPACPYLVDKK